MNPLTHRILPVAAFFLVALAFQAVAAPVGMRVDDSTNAPSLLPYTQMSLSADLQKVVELLKNGKREDAKMELARFLAKNPKDPRATELAGLVLMEEKNWKMAVVSFQRTLAADPQRTAARSKLGVALLMEGKMQEGSAELQKTIAGNPMDAVARRYLGWLAETKGDTQGALSHYGAMIAGGAPAGAVMSEFHVLVGKLYNQVQRPDMTIRLLEPLTGRADSARTAQFGEQVLAQAYLEEGNKVAAGKLVRSLEKKLPGANADLRMLQARLSMLEKDYPKARERLQAVIKDSPAYQGAASSRLAEVYSEEGNWKQAVETLESLAPRLKKNDLAVVLARLTAIQFAHGNGKNTIRTLEKYAKQEPAIQYLLAEAQARNHEYGAALVTTNNLLMESPQFAGGHYLSGMLYKHENKPVHAEKGFSQAVKLIPAYVDAWIEWADMYAAGMPSKAEEILARGLEVNPDNSLLLFKLATMQDENGKTPQANSNYRRILEKMPNHVPALQKLALNLSASPATMDEARKLAERAYGLNRNEPAMQDTYGWILVQSGDAKKGIPLLESAVKSLRNLHGGHSGSHQSEDHSHPEAGNLNEGLACYHLGAAYMMTGKSAEGAAYLNRALGLGINAGTRVQIAALLK
jgi:predicted Zn-dependent protease